jgi:hypothetical protein
LETPAKQADRHPIVQVARWQQLSRHVSILVGFRGPLQSSSPPASEICPVARVARRADDGSSVGHGSREVSGKSKIPRLCESVRRREIFPIIDEQNFDANDPSDMIDIGGDGARWQDIKSLDHRLF